MGEVHLSDGERKRKSSNGKGSKRRTRARKSETGPPTGQQPPPGNTGAQTVNVNGLRDPGEEKFSFRVDWLAATVKGCTPWEVQKVLGGTWEEKPYGFRKMPHCAEQEREGCTLKMGWGSSTAPGQVHFDLPGSYVSKLEYKELQRLAKFIQSKDGHLTRTDHAFDHHGEMISVEKVKEAHRIGQVVKRSRKVTIYQKHEDGRESLSIVGDTIQFGSRQSETCVRVYDKAMEQRGQGKPVEGHWTRVEVEYKGERTAQILSCMAYLEQHQFEELAMSWLRASMDFRDVVRGCDDWEVSAAPVLPWWEKLTEGRPLQRIAVEKVIKRIEKLAQYFTRSVSLNFAVLSAHPQYGREWLEREAERAKSRRWGPKQAELVSQYVEHLASV